MENLRSLQMAAEEKKDALITYTMDEWVEIYSEAVIGLYKRLLDYARVVYDPESKSYSYFWQLVNSAYYLDGQVIGHNLDEMIGCQWDNKKILETLENDYKTLCVIFKDRYVDVLRASFQNELNAEAIHYNTLPDPKDREGFEKLLFSHGAKVFKNVSDLAGSGDISAQVLLGKMYFLGWGTKVGAEEGLYWFKKATESGNGAAFFYAGMAHEYMTCSETGVNLNAESCELYHEAMNAGFTEAAYALYRYYGRYVSGKTGMFRAKKWFNKGIELGSVYCQYEICQAPEDRFATNNVKTVVDWVKAAAHFGVPDALELLGDLYLQGHAGLKVDFEKAESLMEKAGSQ